MKKLLPLILAMMMLLTACAATSAENKPYDFTYQDTVYSGTYTGGLQKKLPNGEGTFSFDDGTNVFTYSGQWTEGQMTGAGKMLNSQFLIKFTDVDRVGKYDGDVVNGIPNGTGSFTATNDEGDTYCYTGEFKDGNFNGQGSRKFETSPVDNEVGTFINGDFNPTPKEILSHFGQEEHSAFTIRALPAEFLTGHADLFTAGSAEGLDALVDTGYRHEAYTKSPDKFGDKLIKLTSLKITQIAEFSAYKYDAVTFMLAWDSDNNPYYIYYLGSVDVYKGDYISAYLLPLDYFTYDNVNGGQTWAVACAAAYITK